MHGEKYRRYKSAADSGEIVSTWQRLVKEAVDEARGSITRREKNVQWALGIPKNLCNIDGFYWKFQWRKFSPE